MTEKRPLPPEARQQAAQDRRTVIQETERRVISGNAQSPMAARISALAQTYAAQAAAMAEEETRAALLAAELAITENVELVPDAPTFLLAPDEEPKE